MASENRLHVFLDAEGTVSVPERNRSEAGQ